MNTYTYSLSDDKLIMPTQMQLTKAQQEVLKYQEYTTQPPNPKLDQEIRAKSQSLAELLRKDKEQAKIKIDELVSSARQMTTEITHSLTAVPVHPYQKLIYDYLGPDFICGSIHDLTIPNNFSPARCLTHLEEIAKETSELQQTHFSILTAEALDTTFEGITSENLNNAFAVLSSTPQGERYVLDDERIKQHLAFAEMVKSIPTEYVIENPIIVAKKILAEFTRIHYPASVNESYGPDPLDDSPIEHLATKSTEILSKMLTDYDAQTELGTKDCDKKPLAEQILTAKQKFLS